MASQSQQEARGVTSLFIWKAKIQHLSEELRSLRQKLIQLSDSPEVDKWYVEARYKMVQTDIKPGAGTAAASAGSKQLKGGESLYTVRLSERPGHCYLMASKRKPSPSAVAEPGGQAGRLTSLVVELGARGDEIISLFKDYAIRMSLSIEGSTYRVGDLRVSIGSCTRGSDLSSVVIQVRYQEATTLDKGLLAINSFVAGIAPPDKLVPVTCDFKGLPTEFSPRHTALQFIQLFQM